ncbi:FUSC family protein [Halomonas denitrificans]|uniref:FUSC family protein n=1 Tax=Halomonas TaxID=2745 RepID=UPI001A8E7F59|nr:MULTISPECIES: FUSC family protein [Halomonas]MBN8414258.1 FUSC family protein [Halomonas litopenaei]MBY5930953.1 FUSC family protein [Halomonas sp. DP8Y7-3]MCA0973384.1 FUSC family protein [Halomonas denitrificans]MED5294160.1 FUSC family protein [Pseudomonadota bacterium]
MLLGRLRDPFINHRHRRLFHVLRVTLALMVTFTIVELLPLQHSGWALVSTVMVMGNLPHVGGVIDKGRQRLAGTLIGAALGLLLISLPIPPWAVQLGSLAGIAVATWWVFGARQAYGGLMFAISLLLVIGDGTQQLDVALWRGLDVLVGTLVGIAATLVFLPHKATDLQRFLLADCLDQMARLYHAHTSSTAAPGIDTRELFKAASQLLIKQRGLTDAVHREGRLSRTDVDGLISYQRRMLSTLELLLETHWSTRQGHEQIDTMEGLRAQQHVLARDIGTLAFEIRTGRPIKANITPFSLEAFAAEASTARSDDGRMLFGPSGYLWLNRELARLSGSIAEQLGKLERLPSKRLRRRAPRHGLHQAPSLDSKEGRSHDPRQS